MQPCYNDLSVHPCYKELYDTRLFSAVFMFFNLLLQKLGPKRDAYFSNKPSVNDDALRSQKLVPHTETLRISVVLLFFPLAVYFSISVSIYVSFLFTRLSEVINFTLG